MHNLIKNLFILCILIFTTGCTDLSVFDRINDKTKQFKIVSYSTSDTNFVFSSQPAISIYFNESLLDKNIFSGIKLLRVNTHNTLYNYSITGNSITIIPVEPLVADEPYFITINRELRDIYLNPLDESRSFAVTYLVSGSTPQVTKVTPSDNTVLDGEPLIRVFFNDPISAVSISGQNANGLNGGFSITDSNNEKVSGRFEFFSDNFIFYPMTLKPYEKYTVKLDSSVKNAININIIEEKTTNFTVYGSLDHVLTINTDLSTDIFAIDTTNSEVLIADNDNNRIIRLDYTGNEVDSWEIPEKAKCVKVDTNGNIWVITDTHRIIKYSYAGLFIEWFGKSSTGGLKHSDIGLIPLSGTGNGEFNNPVDMLFCDDKIIVLDKGNNRIQVFDLNFVYISSIGNSSSGDGELNNPSAFAYMHSKDKIFVADTGNNRIVSFVLSDSSFEKISDIDTPLFISINPFDQLIYGNITANHLYDAGGLQLDELESIGPSDLNKRLIFVADKTLGLIKIYYLSGGIYE